MSTSPDLSGAAQTGGRSRMCTVVWVLCVLVAVAGAALLYRWWSNRPPQIAFAPYGATYESKPDFAQLEHKFPLTTEQRMKLTPENIKRFDQEQIDQIYARLTAGPIPDGAYNGDLFFPKGM